MSKETAIMAVVEEVETDVAVAKVPLAADEGMVETMDVTVAHLDEVMVAAMGLHSNPNTRPNQANQCAIDVVWTVIGLRRVGLPSI